MIHKIKLKHRKKEKGNQNIRKINLLPSSIVVALFKLNFLNISLWIPVLYLPHNSKSFSLFFVFFFKEIFGHAPRCGSCQSVPQEWPHWILNPLSHQGTPIFKISVSQSLACLISRITYTPTNKPSNLRFFWHNGSLS